MTTTFAQEQTFNAARDLSEMIRQGDVGSAAALTGTARQTAMQSAYRAHHARVDAAAVANNMMAPAHREAVLRDPAPQESFARTDNTTFALVGGRYVVVVAGTFGPGTVTLQDANSNVFATFTDNGTATVDLRYGTYSFVVASVTNLAASIKTGTYS